MNQKNVENRSGNLLRTGKSKHLIVKLKERLLESLEKKQQDLSAAYQAKVSKDEIINTIILNSRLEPQNLTEENYKPVKFKLMGTMADKLKTLSERTGIDERKILVQMIEKELTKVN